MGDFGKYDATVQFLPNQFFESIIDSPEMAGPDTLIGGDDDDILIGQEVRLVTNTKRLVGWWPFILDAGTCTSGSW